MKISAQQLGSRQFLKKMDKKYSAELLGGPSWPTSKGDNGGIW